MILYNMRNRGPLEYDKFIYNIFQFVNYTRYYSDKIKGTDMSKLVKDFDAIYQSTINLAEQTYLKYIMDCEV